MILEEDEEDLRIERDNLFKEIKNGKLKEWNDLGLTRVARSRMLLIKNELDYIRVLRTLEELTEENDKFNKPVLLNWVLREISYFKRLK